MKTSFFMYEAGASYYGNYMSSNLLQHIFTPEKRWFFHVIFWFSILVMFTGIDVSEYSSDWQRLLISNAFALPVMMLATYTTLYVILPIFLKRKQYVKFLISFFFAAFVFGLLQRVVAQYVIFPVVWGQSLNHGLWVFYKIAFNIINIYVVVLAATAIKLLKIALQNEYARQLLEKEKLKAELKFLKSQIHPHFLFNTLNNLYALTLTNSSKAPEVVLKLSSLLDYMLFESNVSTVPLSKEISLINNYISLEKLRYSDTLKVNFNFSIDSMEREIAPLLLLPFVEFAFQQSLVDNTTPTLININLNIDKDILHLKVENEQKQVLENTEHKDFKNVKRRLKLLYPHKYQLDFSNKATTHIIDLKLEVEQIKKTKVNQLALAN